MATTVTWVLDSNSKYEISSKEHLIQLMHGGTLYTNAGSIPTNFLNSNYIQTVDIDLLGDSTNILPIGCATYGTFGGQYDGNNLTISNWSFVDSNFGVSTAALPKVGLFGDIVSSVIKNIKLAGVCTLQGFGDSGGMIVGYGRSSSIHNVVCDLQPGSLIEQGVGGTNYSNMGCVTGYLSGVTVTAITLQGTMDRCVFSLSAARGTCGGILAQTSNCTCTLLRNLATFIDALPGWYLGGLIGYVALGSHTKLLNAMTGTLDSTGIACGGVIGFLQMVNSDEIHGEMINSMKGDVKSPTYAGGIFGRALTKAGSSFPSLMNYMGGNIVCPNSPTGSAGLIAYGDDNMATTTSIVAMNGSVYNTVLGRPSNVSNLAYIDSSFGLSYTTDAYSTTTPVTGLQTDPGNNLPIVDLTATDADGVTHTFEFIFGNVATMNIVPRPLNMKVSWPAASGATAYRLTIQASGSNTAKLVKSGFSALETNVSSLVPETEYVLRIYSAADGASYNLYLEATATTLVDSVDNYDIADFIDDRGRYDLSETTGFDELLNNLFTTGDSLVVDVGSGQKKNAKFVKLGESAPISGEEALVLPFNESAGASQTATLTLSDSSTVTVVYDEVEGNVEFGGTTYSAGQSALIDGQKMTIKDV